jgi:hypothetical protein
MTETTEARLREALRLVDAACGACGPMADWEVSNVQRIAREALSLPERKEGDSIQATLSAPAADQSAVNSGYKPREKPELVARWTIRMAVGLLRERAAEFANSSLTAERPTGQTESALELHTTSPPGDPNS